MFRSSLWQFIELLQGRSLLLLLLSVLNVAGEL